MEQLIPPKKKEKEGARERAASDGEGGSQRETVPPELSKG